MSRWGGPWPCLDPSCSSWPSKTILTATHIKKKLASSEQRRKGEKCSVWPMPRGLRSLPSCFRCWCHGCIYVTFSPGPGMYGCDQSFPVQATLYLMVVAVPHSFLLLALPPGAWVWPCWRKSQYRILSDWGTEAKVTSASKENSEIATSMLGFQSWGPASLLLFMLTLPISLSFTLSSRSPFLSWSHALAHAVPSV